MSAVGRLSLLAAGVLAVCLAPASGVLWTVRTAVGGVWLVCAALDREGDG